MTLWLAENAWNLGCGGAVALILGLCVYALLSGRRKGCGGGCGGCPYAGECTHAAGSGRSDEERQRDRRR